MTTNAKVIETDRLILRPPVLEHFEGLARLLADPHVSKSLSANGRIGEKPVPHLGGLMVDL